MLDLSFESSIILCPFSVTLTLRFNMVCTPCADGMKRVVNHLISTWLQIVQRNALTYGLTSLKSRAISLSFPHLNFSFLQVLSPNSCPHFFSTLYIYPVVLNASMWSITGLLYFKSQVIYAQSGQRWVHYFDFLLFVDGLLTLLVAFRSQFFSLGGSNAGCMGFCYSS